MGSSMVTYVVRPGLVDLIDDSGQRGRLARAGGSRDQNETAGLVTEGMQHFGQPQVINGFDLNGNHPKSGCDRPSLEERVDTKTRDPVQGIRQVEFPVGLELLPLILREDAVDHLASGYGVQLGVIQSLQMTVNTDHRRQTH